MFGFVFSDKVFCLPAIVFNRNRSMEELDKLPLKRVELSLSKFNEVAIPHHLDLMRQHRANIIKVRNQFV